MYYSDYNRPPEEREPIIETDQFHVHDTEPPKPKKKGMAAKFVALGLCCALIGGAVGGGGGFEGGEVHFGGAVGLV